MQIKVIPDSDKQTITIIIGKFFTQLELTTVEAESFCLDLKNAVLHNERAARPVLTQPVTPGLYWRGGGSKVAILKVYNVAGKETAFGFDYFGNSYHCDTSGRYGNSGDNYPAMDLVERIGDLPDDLK